MSKFISGFYVSCAFQSYINKMLIDVLQSLQSQHACSKFIAFPQSPFLLLFFLLNGTIIYSDNSSPGAGRVYSHFPTSHITHPTRHSYTVYSLGNIFFLFIFFHYSQMSARQYFSLAPTISFVVC